MIIDMLKFDDFQDAKRILIVGDSGSGKTTLALKFADKLGLPVFHCDDVLYIKKFTEMRNRPEAVRMMADIYAGEHWIVEGTTRDLLESGIERADVVILITFSNIFSQYTSLIKRYLEKREGRLWDLLDLLVYVTKKRFKLTKKMRRASLLEMAMKHPKLYKENYPVSVN